MKQLFILLTISLLSLTGCAVNKSVEYKSSNKLVIAHRGASGYLPEHSIAAKAMAKPSGIFFTARAGKTGL